MNIHKIFVGLSLSALLVCTACDDLLDVNTDPNNLDESTPALTLPVAEVGLAARLESDYNVLGSMLAQYWTTGPTAPQYSNIDRYEITTNDYSTAWLFMYSSVLSDLEFVKTAAMELEQPNYAVVAQLLQMYTFHLLVDMYDEIPFSDALQGKNGNVTPVFDNGQSVYDQLIAKIDEALGWIDNSPIAVTPGAEDVIYGGDMELWQKFGNTLKLKIYIRQAIARPGVAQAGIEALYDAGAKFLEVGEEAKVPFSTTVHNENTLWQELNQTSFQNLVASKTSIDTLLGAGDTRISKLYDESKEDGFVGLIQGIGTLDGGVFDDYARPNTTTIISKTSPSYLITGYESLFLQAEAAARNWSGEDDAALYNEAVLASFAFWGEDGADFIKAGGVYEYDDQLSTIYYQKWLAFNGKQGFEGWTEWRRTGVPALEVSYQGVPLSNTFPLRLVWPVSERSANPNVPAAKSVDTPVWWDTTF